MKLKYPILINRLILMILLITVTATFSQLSAQLTGTTVSDADGNIYNSVVIGDQEWMKENLKTTKFNDNTKIENIVDLTKWARATSAAYSWYDNDSSNKNIYGALNNWHAVNSGKLCPKGWRVPDDNDWQ